MLSDHHDRHPFAAGESDASPTPQARNGLGALAGGSVLITARTTSGHRIGFVVDSFMPFGSDSSLVLWSIPSSSPFASLSAQIKCWTAHFLTAGQDDVAAAFSNHGNHTLGSGSSHCSDDDNRWPDYGAPALECRSVYCQQNATSCVVVARVAASVNDGCALERPSAHIPDLSLLLLGTGGTQPVSTESSVALDNDIDSSLGYLLATAYLQFYSRIRTYASSKGFTEAELFVVSALSARNGRSLHELAVLFEYAGQHHTRDVFTDLCARGLISYEEAAGGDDDPHNTRLYLTTEGQSAARDVVAASHAIELETIDLLGVADATALRRLLKTIVRINDDGLRYRWL